LLQTGVFQNRVLGTVFGLGREGVTGDWEKLYVEEVWV
jgi:hypothetical protein